MPVEDVFTISGRGTVATGKVEQGIVGSTTRSRSSASPHGQDRVHRRRDVPQAPRPGTASDDVGSCTAALRKEEVEDAARCCASPGRSRLTATSKPTSTS